MHVNGGRDPLVNANHGAVGAIEHPHTSWMSDDAPPFSLFARSLLPRFFLALSRELTRTRASYPTRFPSVVRRRRNSARRDPGPFLSNRLCSLSNRRVDWERFRFNGSIDPFGFESGGKDEAHEALHVALASARCIASKMAVFARTASELLREAVHAQELAPYDVRGRRMGARTGGNGRRMELTEHTVQSTQHHGVKTVLEEVEAHAKGMFEVTRCEKRMRRIEARANDGTDSTDEKWRRTARNKP